MDFVIARNFDLKAKRKHLNTKCIKAINGSGLRYSQYDRSIEVLHASGALDDSGGTWIFHGHQLLRDTFISNMAMADLSDGEIISAADYAIGGDQNDKCGVYVAAHVNNKGGIVTTDPLGQLPLFHYVASDNGRWIVSSRVDLIEDALRASQVVVSKSLSPSIENSVFNTSFCNKTHVEGVLRLPAGKQYVFKQCLEIISLPERSTKGMSYGDCIEQARSSIYRQLVAIATSGRDYSITADLTGGADSRCVVSFLLNSPLRNSFGVRCITRSPNPDANIAQRLMNRYGMKKGLYPIFSQGKASLSCEIGVRQNAQLFGGAKDAGAMVPSVAVTNLLHFKGGYGEIGGATPGSDYIAQATAADNIDLEKLCQLWISRRRQSHSIDLVTDDAIAEATVELKRELRSLLEEGVPLNQLQSEMYLRTRSRNHFGMQSYQDMLWKSSPDILCNFWLVEARRRIPQSLHGANKVIFDLIYRNSRELALEPLAGKKWSASILPTGHVQLDYDADPLTLDGVPLYDKIEVRRPAPVGFEPVSRGGKAADTAAFALATNTASYQSIFDYILESESVNSPIWDSYDREQLEAYSKRDFTDFSRNGQDTNAMGIAASGILSLTERGLPPKVTERLEVNA